ncbi:MAG TPA: hypothetical protein VKQ36_15970, partial [Ktedonobacterales bacterium]|nr:hypothetical protein [Ktedonobacterales bacterium]
MAKPLPLAQPSHPKDIATTQNESEQSVQPGAPEDKAQRAARQAIRENARRVLRESGAADILQRLNKQALQGRGWFEEYDSGVIFKWGSSTTRRHIWVDIDGETLRFRLNPHIRCSAPVPACDG